jgi:two-component system cell cycle response regulator DivK
LRQILVAEDNDINRELIRIVLEGQGYEVIEATTGKQALAVLEGTHPDLVLLDIQMPELDGYKVISLIRENPQLKSLKVVALTAFAMDGDRERAMQAGFDGYLTKPIEIASLKSSINSLLPT